MSRLVLQLSLCNILKSCVKSRMKIYLEQSRQAMLQQHLSDQQFYCLLRRDLYQRFDGTIIGACDLSPNRETLTLLTQCTWPRLNTIFSDIGVPIIKKILTSNLFIWQNIETCSFHATNNTKIRNWIWMKCQETLIKISKPLWKDQLKGGPNTIAANVAKFIQ